MKCNVLIFVLFYLEPLWRWFMPVPARAITKRSESEESGEFLI